MIERVDAAAIHKKLTSPLFAVLAFPSPFFGEGIKE
jgi:hypothetical protein